LLSDRWIARGTAKKMKFAEHLAAHITPEWRKQYISYEVGQNIIESYIYNNIVREYDIIYYIVMMMMSPTVYFFFKKKKKNFVGRAFLIRCVLQEMKEMLYAAVEQVPAPEQVDPDSLSRYFAKFDEKFFSFCDKELAKINTFYSGFEQHL